MASTMGLCRMGGNTGFERVFPCIRLRGLPFHATEDDIRLFLSCDTVDVLMVKKDGKFCGEAYVVLPSSLYVDLALTKNRSYMGRRYIEIFRAKKMDYYRAVFTEMAEGSLSLSETRTRRVGQPKSEESGDSKAREPQSTILKLRGLPFKVSAGYIASWFNEGVKYTCPITDDNIRLVADYGRPSGTAFVEFVSLNDAKLAMTKDRQMMGTRYIEIFESTQEERARYTSH